MRLMVDMKVVQLARAMGLAHLGPPQAAKHFMLVGIPQLPQLHQHQLLYQPLLRQQIKFLMVDILLAQEEITLVPMGLHIHQQHQQHYTHATFLLQ